MTIKTPLLIPDGARLERIDDDHAILPLRLGPDGAPYLPPTSVKGMLRSAYEAITNSRLGVFKGHEDALALRYSARSGAEVVPVRVSDCGQHFELLPGYTGMGNNGSPSGSPPRIFASMTALQLRAI